MQPSEALRKPPLVRYIGRMLCIGLLSCMIVGAAHAAGTCTVQTEDLNLRSSPTTSAKVVTTLPKGAELTVVSTETEWAKVTYKGNTGYVNLKHVKMKDDAGGGSVSATPTSNAGALSAPGKKRTDITLKEGDKSEDVLDVQDALRKKGYFKSDLSLEFGEKTKKALILFQTKNDLPSTGVADKDTLKALYGKRSDKPSGSSIDMTDYIEMDEPSSSSGNSSSVPAGDVEPTLVNKDVRLVDWWSNEIQKVMPRNKTVTIIDVESGISFKAQRLGGSNHADMEPLTKEDAALMKKARGGEWGWTARAVYVVIDGQSYAAAINGEPHGDMNIADNGFDGHFCMHFLNSRTHRTNKKNPDMQNRIMEAFEAAGDR